MGRRISEKSSKLEVGGCGIRTRCAVSCKIVIFYQAVTVSLTSFDFILLSIA